MTPQKTDQAPEIVPCSLPTCLDEVLPPLLKELEAETARFEQAKSEMLALDERIAEVRTWITAARSAADDANAECLNILKVKGATPKDALKQKAKHRGALEDIETFNSVISDIETEKSRVEIEAIRAANAVRSVRDRARDDAIEALSCALPGKLPHELFMLVELLADRASSGDSVAFSVDPIFDPLEFALNRVSTMISAAIPVRRHDLGLPECIPPAPSRLRHFYKSPIQMKKLVEEFASREISQ